jgi:CDP-diacylglycerol--glycerol-3-phosphate 3-phosphatidyltransferase
LGSNKRVTTKSPAAASSGEEREHSTREEKILTIPTILTLARVAAIPFVVLAYTRTGPSAVAWCTTLYVLACLTDWLDGYIARKMGSYSKFGAFLDPVSDKLMVTVVLILVTYSSPPEGLCATIPAIVPLSAGVIICREVAMSALREWAASAGSEVRSAVAVNSLGKWKTALQMTALGFLLACKEGCHNNAWLVAFSYLGPIFLLVSALLATYSFVVYFKGIWKFMVNP